MLEMLDRSYTKEPEDLDLTLHGPLIEIRIGPASAPGVDAAPVPTVQIKAMIDTGASITAIHPDVLERLPFIPSVGDGKWVHLGVPGVHHSPKYKVTLLFSRGPAWHDWTVISNKFIQPGIECLIGRDILSKVRFVYDGVNNDFILWFP